MNNLFLVVDVGTSRIKGLLVREDGRIVTIGSEASRTISSQPHWAEQDPNAWWLSTVAIIRTMLKQHRIQRGVIRAISITGQMHGPILIDRKGRPLGNCIIWQDRRAQKETNEITRKVPEKVLYRISGCRLNPYMTGPKLVWIRKMHRARYLKAHRIVLPKDYVRSRFTDDSFTDWTDANGTGLFDMRTKTWAGEIFRELGLDETKMPEIKPPFEVVGEVNAGASRKTGLDKGISVVAGGGDDTVSIGGGAIESSDMAVNLGTSCSTYVSVEKPILDPKMRLECFVGFEEGRWNLSGATTSAGASVDWIVRNTRIHDPFREDVGAYSFLDGFSRRNIRPSGLFFLPYLAGERSPFWDPQATGTLFGITLGNTIPDLVQSVLEGVGFTIRSIVDTTEQLTGQEIRSVRFSGAATSSATWMSMLTNILCKKVVIPKGSEATALGAAMLGAVGIGVMPNVREAAHRFFHVAHIFVPNYKIARAYETAYRQFLKVSRTYISTYERSSLSS
jgi:xylulokinase